MSRRDDDRDQARAMCCVTACREWIRPTRVMCPPHWDLVPLPLRRAIGEAVLQGDPAALAEAKRQAARVVARRTRV